jgi:hypothetical protein
MTGSKRSRSLRRALAFPSNVVAARLGSMLISPCFGAVRGCTAVFLRRRAVTAASIRSPRRRRDLRSFSKMPRNPRHFGDALNYLGS